jgi:hypothetical protein
MPDTKRVFVIHGRNEAARNAMFAFLRAIGLSPIEWSDAVATTAEPNPFIGTVLDSAMGSAQAVLALLTGDDLARLGTRYGNEELTPQPRPNVLFEAGMAMGRFPKQTVLVTLGPNRKFTDIAGRHVLEMDDSVSKRQQLARRLQDAGCAVSIADQTDWHREGQFENAVLNPDLGRSFVGSISRGKLFLCGFGLLAALIVMYMWSSGHNSGNPKSRTSEPAGIGLPPSASASSVPITSAPSVITISGKVTRIRPPHDGIVVGVIPAGALTTTDSTGLYKITLPGPVTLG